MYGRTRKWSASVEGIKTATLSWCSRVIECGPMPLLNIFIKSLSGTQASANPRGEIWRSRSRIFLQSGFLSVLMTLSIVCRDYKETSSLELLRWDGLSDAFAGLQCRSHIWLSRFHPQTEDQQSHFRSVFKSRVIQALIHLCYFNKYPKYI